MSLTQLVRASFAAALIAAVSLAATLPQPAQAQAASAPAAAASPAASTPPAPVTAADVPAAPKPVVSEEAVDNPYGLKALWSQGDFVAKGTLIIMVIMSLGSWYIIFTKLSECSFKPGSDENGKPTGGTTEVEYVWKIQ